MNIYYLFIGSFLLSIILCMLGLGSRNSSAFIKSIHLLKWVLFAWLLVMPDLYKLGVADIHYIEQEYEVENEDSIMCLETGYSYVDTQQYILSSNNKGLEDFLDKSVKSVMLYVKRGDSIIYREELGYGKDIDIERINSLYTFWRNEGVVKRVVSYIELGCFYVRYNN